MSFYQAKTKIRKSDQLFSIYIRCRDMGCVYRKKCSGQVSFKQLQNSHFYKRRYESIRYNPHNCDAACRACHMWVENTAEGQQWLYGFKLKQLGQNAINILAMKKQGYSKHNALMEMVQIKEAKYLISTLTQEQRDFKEW